MRSVHPLYDQESLTSVPEIVGAWLDEDNDSYHIEQSGVESYLVTLYGAEEGELQLRGHLVRLGDHLFLDLFPEESEIEDVFSVPVHVFFRVELGKEKNTLALSPLSPDWLEDQLEEDESILPHEQLSGAGEIFEMSRILLTASTEQLQDFFRLHADKPEAFPPFELRRE